MTINVNENIQQKKTLTLDLVLNTNDIIQYLKSQPIFNKVAVLMGGSSKEREVSIMSGTGVLNALQKHGINAYAFDPLENNIFELQNQNFTACFIALHGRYGEDGTLQGLLEYLKIPYTGSGVMASSVAMNKEMTKRIWQTYDIPTPKFLAFNIEATPKLSDLDLDLIAKLQFPLIVKPACQGSSIGLTKIHSIDELPAAYETAKVLDQLILIEEFITGRELTCAVFTNPLDQTSVALPVIEIKAPDANYDYQNKYFSDDVQYECPANIDLETTHLIQELSIKAFDALNCKTWARVDLMIDANGPSLLEINTSPGMTSHSLVPMAAKALGCDYETLVLHLLSQASFNKLS